MFATYWRRLGALTSLTLVLFAVFASRATAQVSINQLDYRDYDLGDMGISSPGALTYAADNDLFYIAYASQEAPLRIFVVTPHESLVDVLDLDIAVNIAVNSPALAYDIHTARLLVYDALSQQLFALETEENGTIDAAAELSRYSVAGLEIQDAAGMVVSATQNHLYILDNATHELLRVAADASGDFVVLSPDASRVSRITLDLPTTATVRGLAFDEQTNSFYTLDTHAAMLYQLTASGERIATFDLSTMALTSPGGVEIAPTADATDDATRVDLFLTDSGLRYAAQRHAAQPTSAALSTPLSASVAGLTIKRIAHEGHHVCYVASSQMSGRLVEIDLDVLLTRAGEGSRAKDAKASTLASPLTSSMPETQAAANSFSPPLHDTPGIPVDDVDITLDPAASQATAPALDPAFLDCLAGTGGTATVRAALPPIYLSIFHQTHLDDGFAKDLLWVDAPSGAANSLFFEQPAISSCGSWACFHRDMWIYHPVGHNGVEIQLTSFGDAMTAEHTGDGSAYTQPNAAAIDLTSQLEHLFVAGDSAVVQTLLAGTAVRIDDICWLDPAVVARAVYTTTFRFTAAPEANPYLFAGNRALNFGTEGISFFVAAAAADPNNSPPVVDAGPDQTLTGTLTVHLDATVHDDGLPIPPAQVTTFWSRLSGPSSAIFADNHAVDTSVTFAEYGTYVLRLFAADGSLGKSDDVVITVEPEFAPPVIDAGDDLVVTLAQPALAVGTVETAAGEAGSAITTTWSMVTGPDVVTFSTPSAISTEVTLPVTGSYVLRLTADDGQVEVSDSMTITATQASSPTIFERRIADDWDDVEERDHGLVTNNNDLELVFDNDGNQTVGLRFLEINVPPGAVISRAYVQFAVDEISPDPADLTIHGAKSADAPYFSDSELFGLSTQPRTQAAVLWQPPPWLTPDEANVDQRTADISPIIQELVNQPQWERGNDLAIIITGTGERVAKSFDLDPASAPLLHIEFTTPLVALDAQETSAGME